MLDDKSEEKNKNKINEKEGIEKTEEAEEENKDLEIVKGNSKDLKISPVYDHVKSDKIPGSEKKENIVIPKSSNSDK